MGLRKMNNKYDHKEIIAYYLEGNNQVETAKHFGASKQTVFNILKENKIETRPVDKVGEKNPNWKGGEIDDGYGRKFIYSPGHPNPSNGVNHVYEYRLIMEKILGRYLAEDEIVHHINGDHSDNRPENLKVMSQSKHASNHNKKYNKEEVLSYFLKNGGDASLSKFNCNKKTLHRILRECNHYVGTSRGKK